MASGSYTKKLPASPALETDPRVPARATRTLNIPVAEGPLTPTKIRTGILPAQDAREKKSLKTKNLSISEMQGIRPPQKSQLALPKNMIYNVVMDNPLSRHRPWLLPLTISLVTAVLFIIVLLSAGMYQRPDGSGTQLLNFAAGGQVYDVQVGGQLATSWQKNQPIPAKTPLPVSTGPYSVLSAPTLSVDTINKILAAYNSPAAGKGQALYDLGKQYGIDPAFALAFFMHESTFGTRGEATSSLSLGNLRCIPNTQCTDGYAWFPSWEAGFKAWYELIRNLYVAYWGRTTIETIIPKYAPTADNNDEAAYIASLKHELDTWHAGNIIVA